MDFSNKAKYSSRYQSLVKAREHGCEVVNMGIEGGNEGILKINQTTSKSIIIDAVNKIHICRIKSVRSLLLVFLKIQSKLSGIQLDFRMN